MKSKKFPIFQYSFLMILSVFFISCSNSSNSDPISIKNYEGNLNIQEHFEYDSSVIGVMDQQINIMVSESCGEGCKDSYFVSFIHEGNDELPFFCQATYIRSETDDSPFIYHTTETIELEYGTIEIQNWNIDESRDYAQLSGIVSGNINFAFWYSGYCRYGTGGGYWTDRS